MLRKLLAILVLVTGLAAAGAPAQARAFDMASVRTVEAGLACPAQARSGIPAHIARNDRIDARPRACPRPKAIVVVVPTVMLRIDRARE